jgi:hypothetical protein
VPVDNFSAIYSGKFTPAESGSYTLPVQIDDDGFFFLSGVDIGGSSLISDSVQAAARSP